MLAIAACSVQTVPPTQWSTQNARSGTLVGRQSKPDYPAHTIDMPVAPIDSTECFEKQNRTFYADTANSPDRSYLYSICTESGLYQAACYSGWSKPTTPNNGAHGPSHRANTTPSRPARSSGGMTPTEATTSAPTDSRTSMGIRTCGIPSATTPGRSAEVHLRLGGCGAAPSAVDRRRGTSLGQLRGFERLGGTAVHSECASVGDQDCGEVVCENVRESRQDA